MIQNFHRHDSLRQTIPFSLPISIFPNVPSSCLLIFFHFEYQNPNYHPSRSQRISFARSMYPSATESIKFEFASFFEEETKTVEILLDRSYKSSIVNTVLYASSIFLFFFFEHFSYDSTTKH